MEEQAGCTSKHQTCQRELAALLRLKSNRALTLLQWLWLFNRVAWADSLRGTGREETTVEKNGQISRYTKLLSHLGLLLKKRNSRPSAER